jgi:hypothetical protein
MSGKQIAGIVCIIIAALLAVVGISSLIFRKGPTLTALPDRMAIAGTCEGVHEQLDEIQAERRRFRGMGSDMIDAVLMQER